MGGEHKEGGEDMETGRLKVPTRQPKRGRLWLNDGSCVRLRPQYPNHVWAYDFVQIRLHDAGEYDY